MDVYRIEAAMQATRSEKKRSDEYLPRHVGTATLIQWANCADGDVAAYPYTSQAPMDVYKIEATMQATRSETLGLPTVRLCASGQTVQTGNLFGLEQPCRLSNVDPRHPSARNAPGGQEWLLWMLWQISWFQNTSDYYFLPTMDCYLLPTTAHSSNF